MTANSQYLREERALPMIKFRCSHCDQKIGLSDEYAGRQVRCAKCKQTIVVPPTSTETDAAAMGVIRFKCNVCGWKSKAESKHSGRKVKCPQCGTAIVVPQFSDESTLGASTAGGAVADKPPVQQESSLPFQLSSEAAGSIRCSSCGAIHSAGRKFCTLCGQSLTTGAGSTEDVNGGPGQARGEAEAAEISGKGSIVSAILVSIVFAVIGGIVWTVAAKLIGIGWTSFMAVAVCCLAGAGFYLCTSKRSVGIGILAAIIGFGGILSGKTLIARYVAMPQVREFMSDSGGHLGKVVDSHPMKDEFYEEMTKDKDLMFTMAAMQLAEDGQIEEELVEDVLAERQTGKQDPQKAQQIEQAKSRIQKTLDSWSKEKKKEVAQAQFPRLNQKHIDSFMKSQTGKTFASVGAWFWSFSCQDIVWIPLGMFCAYKVARGEE